jgi:hypothetical protein
MSNREFHEVPREPPRWELWFAGTTLVAGILLASILLLPSMRHQLALSVTRENTPYTQLAFTDAAALPTTAVAGKAVKVSFVVTNNEGKPMQYQYVVASGGGAKLETLTSSSNTVAAGATWNVNTTVVPKCAATATVCRVQVSLPGQGESIDFMLAEPRVTKTAKAK